MIAATYARNSVDQHVADEEVVQRDPLALSSCLVVAISLLFASCAASSSKTYGPDGSEAHTLNCSGLARSWDMCARAGRRDIRGTRGYDVIAGGARGRVMLIKCK